MELREQLLQPCGCVLQSRQEFSSLQVLSGAMTNGIGPTKLTVL
jgi:hypothetical protein